MWVDAGSVLSWDELNTVIGGSTGRGPWCQAVDEHITKFIEYPLQSSVRLCVSGDFCPTVLLSLLNHEQNTFRAFLLSVTLNLLSADLMNLWCLSRPTESHWVSTSNHHSPSAQHQR